MIGARFSVKAAAKVLVAAALLGMIAVAPSRFASANMPANKVAISGSALEVMSSDVTEGESSEPVTLLHGVLRTSSPADLILSVSAECALWTDITTVGNDVSEAASAVVVWVEIDGKVVPVSSSDVGAPGEVVFCNRAFRRETLMFDDEDATIKSFLRTRSANAFSWGALNVGAAVHTIEVKGRLDNAVEGTGRAKAAVGKRTLVVEPVHMSNDATI